MIQISKDFIEKSRLNDSTYCVNQEIFQSKEGDCISFLQENYSFSGKFAHEEFCFLSNNDYSLKEMVFPIIGKKNLTIDGRGSDFNFMGRIMPFYLKDCENITLKNFSIDYPRPFFSHAEILEVEDGSVIVSIDREKYPYRIIRNTIEFYGEDYAERLVFGMLSFDKEEKRPVKAAADNGVQMHIRAEELSEGKVRLFWNFVNPVYVGEVLSIKLDRRYVPAIGIDSCQNIKLENI